MELRFLHATTSWSSCLGMKLDVTRATNCLRSTREESLCAAAEEEAEKDAEEEEEEEEAE